MSTLKKMMIAVTTRPPLFTVLVCGSLLLAADAIWYKPMKAAEQAAELERHATCRRHLDSLFAEAERQGEDSARAIYREMAPGGLLDGCKFGVPFA